MAIDLLKWLDNNGNEGDKSNGKTLPNLDSLQKIKGEDLNSIRDKVNEVISPVNGLIPENTGTDGQVLAKKGSAAEWVNPDSLNRQQILDILGYEEKLMWSKGMQRAFALTDTPDPNDWELDTHARDGDTIVQSSGSGMQNGLNKVHSHIQSFGLEDGQANGVYHFGESGFGTNTIIGGYSLPNKFQNLPLTSSDGIDGRIRAAGFPAKYYKAKRDIWMLVRKGGVV